MENSELIIQGHEKIALAVIDDWLPPFVFDSHCHSGQAEPGKTVINPAASNPGETFNFFPWEAHEQAMTRLFGKRSYCAATFAFPFGDEYQAANDYLMAQSLTSTQLLPVLWATLDTPLEYLAGKLTQGFVGLKMYPTRRQKKETTEITAVWPRPVLELANKLGTNLIMHLPNGILRNLKELIELATTYPSAHFIVAHLGNAYCFQPDLAEAYGLAARRPNIYFDTAIVSDHRVIAEAIRQLGTERILFGSDAPFSYIRGGYIVAPNGRLRLQSQFRFSWIRDNDWIDYKNQTADFQLVHLNIILAIKRALVSLGLSYQHKIKEYLFFQNAQTLFGEFTRR